MINNYDDDFGTICICAERYALGRQTYMPSLVQNYIKLHIDEIDDKAIQVMIRDITEAEESTYEKALGDPVIDRPGWIAFKKTLNDTLEQRVEKILNGILKQKEGN